MEAFANNCAMHYKCIPLTFVYLISVFVIFLDCISVFCKKVYFFRSPFCPIWAVFGPFLRVPGPKLGAPSFSKLVQNLRLGPPTTRSTFVPRCSNRLGPPEPSDRHFGRFGLFLGRFWALEVPNLTNFVSGKWNEARGTLRVEKNVPVDPNGKKNFGPPP